jgi:hypothetical protein
MSPPVASSPSAKTASVYRVGVLPTLSNRPQPNTITRPSASDAKEQGSNAAKKVKT